jgi:Mg2+ and Co2+ transporter CorA
MSANNLTNPSSTPNETTVATMQEARQMSAKSTENKKESTLAKLKKGEMAQQKLHDMRVAFDESFAIIREVGVMPSSLHTELASVFHSNSVEPRYINSELVKNDIKLYKAEKEINATHAKRLKEALSENAHLKSQLEQMKQMTGMSGCPTPVYGFYNGSPILDPNSPKMPFSDNGSINNYGFQNLFAPPNSFPGRYPVSPFPGNQPVHPGELLQRIMNLEAEVTKLQQRSTGGMFQPQQPMGNYQQQKSGMDSTVRHNQGAYKVYGYVEELLKTKLTITVAQLSNYMNSINFQWSQHLPDHLSPSRWLEEVLSSAPPFVSFHFKSANNHLERVIASKYIQSSSHQPPVAPNPFTQMTENEKQIAAYIHELVIGRLVYKYTTVGNLITHMSRRGYVWDVNLIDSNATPEWVNQICSTLVPAIGLMYTKASKIEDSCIAAHQPEVNQVLLNHVLDFMKLHSDFSHWSKNRLITNLCTCTGTVASFVDCYFHEWEKKGVVQEVTEAASLASNAPYIKRLEFDMAKVSAMM